MMAQEAAILKAQAQFDEMVDVIRRASGTNDSLDQVERTLWNRLLAVGRARPEVRWPGTARATWGRQLSTAGGPFAGWRRCMNAGTSGVRGARRSLGRSTALGRPRGTKSCRSMPCSICRRGIFRNSLQEWDQAFCVQHSYAKSCQMVGERVLGIGQSVRSLEQMNMSMAEGVDSFVVAQASPASEEEGSVLVLTADGKGVPMRRDRPRDGSTPRGRRKKGRKPTKETHGVCGLRLHD